MRLNNICLAFAPATSSIRCWKPSHHPSCTHPSHLVVFQAQHHRRHQSQHLSIMHADTNKDDGHINGVGVAAAEPSSSELEIEQKFSIPDTETAKKMEQTLASLGFKISRKEEFVDWYFDLPAPHWHFSLNDCWFRYREKKVKIMNNWGWRGAWQVKRGKKDEHGGDGMTVYEELQGKDAKELIVQSVLATATPETDIASQTASFNSQYDGYDIPFLAGAERLVPFARLETLRTSYEAENDCEFSNLKVDIDKTGFGYMVGEVEAVLNSASEEKSKVQESKEQIRKLVHLISSDIETDKSLAAIGKLEYYLINNQREHYDACVKSGVIQQVVLESFLSR